MRGRPFMNPCVIGFFSTDVAPPPVAARRRPINEMDCNYVLIRRENVVGRGGVGGGVKVVVVHLAGAPFITVVWGRKVGVSLITHTHAHSRRCLGGNEWNLLTDVKLYVTLTVR